VHAPAAAGRDTAELLDVDVDQVADALVLVADDLAQLLAGRGIEVTEAVESAADEDAVHGSRRHGEPVLTLQVGSEPGRPVLGLPPQRLHQIGKRLARAGRAGQRAGGVVMQPVLTVRAPSRVPLRQAAAGDPGFRRDVRDRTPGVHALT